MTARRPLNKPPYFDPRPRPPCARHFADDLVVSCFHEGGHVVTAIELKIPFTSVDIIRSDDGALGHVRYNKHHEECGNSGR